MVKSGVKVFARLRPEKNRKHKTNYEVHHRPKDNKNEDFLILTAPAKVANEYIDNRPESWHFSYYKIFEERTQQHVIFDEVALPVINSVLEGYNGTIFAYGQTGSGKTFSITGDHWNYEDRGILPRTLEHIFQYVRKHPENLFMIEVAYLEIYNENGYDLLDRKQHSSTFKVEDLPRVCIQEDESGKLHLKNLSFRRVFNEKDALDLLFTGDTNRVTTVTPMNPLSSRSHGIFTIIISMKKVGEDNYRRAKVHFVDLAGSERVYKCAITGTILTEAKHINLSLHYLEQVIVCLGQENSNHIPYRNCLLTAILRDSLGGNCLTTMLTTLSVSVSNLEETISSCRFAQRVALIQNDVRLILDRDIYSENELLKMENERLKEQIDTLTKQQAKIGANDKIKRVQSDYNTQQQNQLTLFCSDACAKNLGFYKNLLLERDEKISALVNLLNQATNMHKKRKIKKKESGISDSEKQSKTEVKRNNDCVSAKSNPGSPEVECDATVKKTKTRKKSNRGRLKADDNGSAIGSVVPHLRLDEVFDNEEKSNATGENSASIINSRSRPDPNDKSICLVSGQKQLQDRQNKDKTIHDKSPNVVLNSTTNIAVQVTLRETLKDMAVQSNVPKRDSAKDVDKNRKKLVSKSTVTDVSSLSDMSVQTFLSPKFLRNEKSISNTSVQTRQGSSSKSTATDKSVNEVYVQTCNLYDSKRKVVSRATESYLPATNTAVVQTFPTSDKNIEINPYLRIVDFIEKENLVNNVVKRSKSSGYLNVKNIELNNEMIRQKSDPPSIRMPPLEKSKSEDNNNLQQNFSYKLLQDKQSVINKNSFDVFSSQNEQNLSVSKLKETVKVDEDEIKVIKEVENKDSDQKNRSRTVIQLIENFQKDLDATMEMIQCPELSNTTFGNKIQFSEKIIGNQSVECVPRKNNYSNDSTIFNDELVKEGETCDFRFTTDTSLPLTGDPEIDEEIKAYFKAKLCNIEQKS